VAGIGIEPRKDKTAEIISAICLFNLKLFFPSSWYKPIKVEESFEVKTGYESVFACVMTRYTVAVFAACFRIFPLRGGRLPFPPGSAWVTAFGEVPSTEEVVLIVTLSATTPPHRWIKSFIEAMPSPNVKSPATTKFLAVGAVPDENLQCCHRP